MKKTLNVLRLFMVFVSAAGIMYGGLLIISPSGSLARLPLTILDGTPFTSFLLPGFLMVTVFGSVLGLLMFKLVKKTAYKFAKSVDSLDYTF